MAGFTETIYEEHGNALFAFLLQLTRHEADTKDLLQEVFLKVSREPEKYQRCANLRSFLFRVAHNLFRDHCRRRGASERMVESLGQEIVELFVCPAQYAQEI